MALILSWWMHASAGGDSFFPYIPAPIVPVAPPSFPLLFFFNDTATTEIYTLSLHDALPISSRSRSSSDGSSHASPRRRRAPVKLGGRLALKARRPSSPSVVTWINRLLVMFWLCQAWSAGRSPKRAPNSFIMRNATGALVTMPRGRVPAHPTTRGHRPPRTYAPHSA